MVAYEAEMGFVIPYMAVGWKIRRANGGVQPPTVPRGRAGKRVLLRRSAPPGRTG